MSIKKSYTIALACACAALLFSSCGSTEEVVEAEADALNTEITSAANDAATDLDASANKLVQDAKDETLGKIFPTPNLSGDIVLNVTLPENATAINLYRKAEDESDYQLVYQAWGDNGSAKDTKGKKIEIIDYFVETGKKYDYKCNFRLLIDPDQTAYAKENLNGTESNEITVMPVKGYGDFKLTNKPAATYDQNTSRLTFTTLPQTNMSSVKLPAGLTKQPVKFVYVNPELYSLWINAPEDGEVPVFITLGKIEGIDSPEDEKAVMIDTPLKSDDGDGGWRLSIDKDDLTTTDGWTYEEHWFRKYTGSEYGLPASIVIPANTVQKNTAPAPAQSAPAVDAK